MSSYLVATHGRRARADQRRGRRRHGQRHHHRRQARTGTVRAAERDRPAALLQRLFRREVSVAQARPDRDPERLMSAPWSIGAPSRSERTTCCSTRRKDAPSARRGIFALIAHEIAHQWFGNLVTMTLVGQSLAQRRLRHLDGIQGDRAFPSALADLAQQLRREARRDAAGCRRHRASDPPAGPDKSEASEMFDDITYNKAGAIVRMLEGYLGPEVFRAGVRKYVADHAYGNTTPADLWRALEAVSGKPVDGGGDRLHRAERRAAGHRRDQVHRRRAAHHAAPGALHAAAASRASRRRPGRSRSPDELVQRAAAARTRPADAGAARDRGRPLRRSRQAQPRRHRLLPRAVRRRDARGARPGRSRCCRRRTASTCWPTPGRWSKPAAARRPPISNWSSRSATTAVRSGTR